MSQAVTTPVFSPSSRTPASRPSVASRHNSQAATTGMSSLLTPRIKSPQVQQQPAASTPSPNYFGFQANNADGFLTGSLDQHAKTNWSPPSSSVRSAAAISPTVIPLEQRPEFAAFRKQSDSKVFSLSSCATIDSNAPTSKRPVEGMTRTYTAPTRNKSQASQLEPTKSTGGSLASVLPSGTRSRNASIDSGRLGVAQSPKRLLSPGSLLAQEQVRRSTPATNEPVQHDSDDAHSTAAATTRSHLPLDQPFSGFAVPKPRKAAPPAEAEADTGLMLPAQRFVELLEAERDAVLVLDLRVSTQYTTSHIFAALNLCIPTTLLKRPSFNVQKLAETFKDEEQRAIFEQWNRKKYIVVYDNASSKPKDAVICLNTIKKFETEGYTGTMHVVKGGYLDFSRRYPAYVESNNSSPSSTPERQLSDSDGPEVVPVAGGCPMPAVENAANPFFGNIRQNMDLIGGVGQIALQHPKQASKSMEDHAFPKWLKAACDEQDQGERVSKSFEQIERREKKRMEDALCGKIAWNTPGNEAADGVRIAGLEQGSKNRYNNIYPFEHSRVKLQGVSQSGSDYFNASHIQATLSNKRYISTQAPIPATFNDFWNIVWQQDVRVIVMLTAEKEGAQVKAHNYWDQRRYGPIHLDFLSEKRASLDVQKIMRRKHHRPSADKRHSSNNSDSAILAEIPAGKEAGDQPYVVVRKFTMSHEGFPFERMRELTQLHYSSWPDFGAPAHPMHLIGLVEQTDAVVRSIDRTKQNEPVSPNHRPVIVHCSAGCGRTGTFCTVDSVIDMLKRQRLSDSQNRHSSPMDMDRKDPSASPISGGSWVYKDDLDLIERTVEDFRLQRISMVQSLRQYVLCYESIMEWAVEQELDKSAVA